MFYYKFKTSYYHYRRIVCLGRIRSVYRSLYYEIRHKEPWV